MENSRHRVPVQDEEDPTYIGLLLPRHKLGAKENLIARNNQLKGKIKNTALIDHGVIVILANIN